MKKSTSKLSFLIALVILVQTLFSTPVSASAANTALTGSGTLNDPYLLTTAEQFAFLDAHQNSHFKLANDIDFSEITSFTAISSFSGVLDGNNKKILNLSINAEGTECAALFNTLTSAAVVQDLTFVNPQLFSSSGNGVGALAINLSGIANNVGVVGGTITTTHAGGAAYSGALAATAHASLDNCYSTGTTVNGISVAGGLIGYAYDSSITNCYSSSTVNAPTGQAGGLIGVSVGGSLNHCYANGAVSGCSATSGGLIGVIRITPPNPALPSINDCYWDITATGQNTYAILENYTDYPAELPDGAVGIGIPAGFHLTPSASPAFIPLTTVPSAAAVNGSWTTDPYYSVVSISLNGAVSALYNGTSAVYYFFTVGNNTMTLSTQVTVAGATEAPVTIIAETGNSDILINGTAYQAGNDYTPKYINSVLFVPIRLIGDIMHYTVDWEEDTHSVILTDQTNGNYAVIQIDSTTVYKYNSAGTLTDTITLTAAPTINSYRTYVPASLFSAVWGLQVNIQNTGNRSFVLISNHTPAWNSTQLAALIADAAQKL